MSYVSLVKAVIWQAGKNWAGPVRIQVYYGPEWVGPVDVISVESKSRQYPLNLDLILEYVYLRIPRYIHI